MGGDRVVGCAAAEDEKEDCGHDEDDHEAACQPGPTGASRGVPGVEPGHASG
jgi:hypothetical protein